MSTTERAPHPRLIFAKLRSVHSPDNRFAVTVDLTAPDGEPFTGICEGEDSPIAQLESAATAAIRALEVAANHKISLAIRRTTEISDLNTILVHLSISSAERHNGLLLGRMGFVNDQPLHAAVKATLKATNRMFENDFATLQ